MRVAVHTTLPDFADDCLAITKKAPKEFSRVVREGIRVGNSVAKDFARESAGRHGKLYPNAFSYEMKKPYLGAESFVYSGEYGPDSAKPQGGMEFEFGSRNQPPHLDLNKSADLIGPSFGQEARQVLDGLFW